MYAKYYPSLNLYHLFYSPLPPIYYSEEFQKIMFNLIISTNWIVNLKIKHEHVMQNKTSSFRVPARPGLQTHHRRRLERT